MASPHGCPIITFMGRTPLRVTIVGGGVAALETLIALRALAEDRVALELITPSAEWTYRPLAVGEPFGTGAVKRYDLVRIARDHGAALHLAGIEAVEPDERRVLTWDGRRLTYDVLVVTTGAVPAVSLPGSVTIGGTSYTARFRAVLQGLGEGRVRHLAFALPTTVSWPLPLYELALMTADRTVSRAGEEPELSIVTPEREPLELFAAPAANAVARLLDQRRIAFHGGQHPAEVRTGELITVPGGSIPADSVISLPEQRGPSLPGLPHDARGFIPTDLHGNVQGHEDVFAAGDVTTYPLKQGGLAAQQAAAAAESVAARAGAPIEPQPFRPVVRGLLLTGGKPEFVRADVSGAADRLPESSPQPLWWPPSKIATRWLAPYLALKHGEVETPPAGIPVEAKRPRAADRLSGDPASLAG
jgi:sulfide:quinone oxidoreductase